jgi:peptidoglycan hydrolase-like protein with peptidoglycan-binding domain
MVEMDDKILTADELINVLKENNVRYKRTQIHHTWRPNHSSFNGRNHLSLQQGMRNYHVNVRGWNDIGQHVTLMPDGLYVTGRDFNDDSVDFNEMPAGISGYNTGAFMTEILGDFDKGKDKLEGAQLEALLKVQHYLVHEASATIMFHRDKSAKTCPGTGINKNWFLKAVDNIDPSKNVKVTKPDIQIADNVVVNYLNKGDKSSSVKALQNKLISLGYELPEYGADGDFGNETLKAVKNFQKDNGLVQDGIVGPKTSEKLGQAKAKSNHSPIKGDRNLRMGMRGSDVRTLQSKLNSFGFNIGRADSIFGPQTESGLKQFQKRVGISVDGIYGPNTRQKLKNYSNRPGYPGKLIMKGSKSDNVKLVQRIVGVKDDGIFGPNTEKAVRNWQRKNHLVADGLVGPKTWNKMF